MVRSSPGRHAGCDGGGFRQWIELGTFGPLERIMREIPRWTRVVGAFSMEGPA